jgi:hypothetical protein
MIAIVVRGSRYWRGTRLTRQGTIAIWSVIIHMVGLRVRTARYGRARGGGGSGQRLTSLRLCDGRHRRVDIFDRARYVRLLVVE